MLPLNDTRVALWVLLLGIGLCFGISRDALGQRMIITDADVNLKDVDIKVNGGQGERGTRSSAATSKDRVVTDNDSSVSKVKGRRPASRAAVPGPDGSEVGFSGGGRSSRNNLNSILDEAVYKESARYSIDPALVFSLIWQESGGKAGAVSPKGA